MNTVFTVAIVLLLASGPDADVRAQSTALVELRDLSPRELRMEAFVLDAPQALRVEAVGAHDRDRPRWNDDGWGRDRGRERPDYWPGEAWILDARTREVVWTLRDADTVERRDVHAFDGTVALPAGTYEAYYASYPGTAYYVWSDDRDDGDDEGGVLSHLADAVADLFDDDRPRRKGYGGRFVENGAYRDFKLVVRGEGRRADRAALARAREAATEGAFVTLTGLGDDDYREAGFRLTRPTEIEVYALGEARGDEAYDYGWILDADTRERVWALDARTSDPAGGSDKNRVVRRALSLPAGPLRRNGRARRRSSVHDCLPLMASSIRRSCMPTPHWNMSASASAEI
ncbi:MAG: hypothetical protein R3362_13140, partial [Rhodothermales bacterium]|nr:hypothetical protein [Rhodothermales bacterium]